MWRSWLARFVRDEEAGGSSPLIPTLQKKEGFLWNPSFFWGI